MFKLAWSKNGTPDTLSGTADVMNITDLTAKKFNQYMHHAYPDTNNLTYDLTFNSNTNTVYATRHSTNGGADSTSTSQTHISLDDGANLRNTFSVNYLISISGEEKLTITFMMFAGAAGATTAPDRKEQVGKFVPSPDADITSIAIDNSGGTGDYDTGSNLSALGTD